MRYPPLNILLIALCLSILASCGGGGSSGSVTVPVPPPVAKSDVVALGPVDSTAPLTINGTSYATGSAAIEINGAPGTAADLKIGQMVTLTGETQSGVSTAARIEYRANVIGPIESVDLNAGFLVVMGQRVHITMATILDAAVSAGSVGGIAEISGHVDGRGEIVATRVMLVADSGQRVLRATPGYVDNANFLFRAGSLTVDFGSATLIDIPGGVVSGDIEVAVSGTLDGSGVLVADSLDGLERDIAGVSGFDGSLSGVVTRFESISDFDVAGVGVRTSSATSYAGGDAGDVFSGALINIEGRVTTDGFLEALQIILSADAVVPGQAVFDFTGFTGLKVDGPFQTVVDRGTEFLVEIEVDEDVVELLDVRREGSQLRIGFRDDANVNTSVLRARVVMPELSVLELAGATFATVRGFDGANLDISLAGAVLLVIKAARYENVSAGLTGACALLMEDSTISVSAEVDIVAASAATLNMAPGTALNGSLVAASALLYYGDAVALDVSSDITSAVTRLGGSL